MLRIGAMGGTVACGAGGEMRVKVDSPDGEWRVAVARSLGGSEWKSGGISDVADVSTFRLDPSSHSFLVLASDGIWGVLDEEGSEGGATQGQTQGATEEGGVSSAAPLNGDKTAARRSKGVVLRVAAARSAGMSAGDIAEGLVRCAEREGGTDNASCIVLLLGRVEG